MEETKAPEQRKQKEFEEQIQEQELNSTVDQRQTVKLKHRQWWISVSIYIALVIAGRSFVALLQNFYYVQTGRGVCDDPRQFTGTWIQALVQNIAFPLILIPLFLFRSSKSNLSVNPVKADNPSCFPLILLYLSLGILLAAYSKLYAVAKTHMYIFFPWISATQLIFTSVFAAFINKHKFNRWIIISVILSTLAAAGGVSDDSYLPCEDEGYKMDVGTWCSFFGTAVFSLSLCVMQLGFQKVIPKWESRTKKGVLMVLEMQFYMSMIAALICVVGFVASSEFKDMRDEFETFGKGKAVYVLSLIGLGVSWQVWSVGLIGLVHLVSCIFSNAVSMCVSPVAAILVVFAFRYMDDEVDWWKGGALCFAILGFAAYVYSLFKSKKKELAEANQRENNDQT